MKTKALFFALVAALALVCTAVSCKKDGANGVYGVSTQGESYTELRELVDAMHKAVKDAVGTVTTRSDNNDSKALSAAQGVLDKSSRPSEGGTIILYFAPSTPIGQPDAEKVILKTWQLEPNNPQ